MRNFANMENDNNSKKHQEDFIVAENIRLADNYALLKLVPERTNLIDANIMPGQFVQVKTPFNSTYLRRPISVCFVDKELNQLWLLVRRAGDGTNAICDAEQRSRLNVIYPLGNGFSTGKACRRTLLIGGGVGVAPLLYLGNHLDKNGCNPTFLLGARSAKDILLFDEFAKNGDVYISTEDGTSGQKGLVTTNNILESDFDMIYCCGPMPMMKAVAKIARERNIECEVSLENVMACGVGACLCCVEKTVEGNLCVCKEGPVFNIDRLTWK